jgi:hypothetical protein
VDDHARRVVRKVFLLFGLFVLSSRTTFADIGVVVLEPVKAVGYISRAGHVATYLSHICPDDGPSRMRLCRPDEHGGVVSKSTPAGRNGAFDWTIVPFEEFLNGFASEDLAPIIAADRLRDAIQAHNTGAALPAAIRPARFDRTVYVFSIPTTRGEDQRIIDFFNRTSNASHFNVLYDNSSDQARTLFSLVMPRDQVIGDRIDGLTMETPKGLTKALVTFARKHPEFSLRAERYVQTPGTASRSREMLFPLENVYSNPTFAPYWFFSGFREFAAGAFVYHKLFARFSIPAAFRRFSAPAAAGLTKQQRRAYAAEFQQIVGRRADGRTAHRLLREFETRGVFSIDELGPGPWMTLRLSGEEDVSTGLSASQIGAGDPRLAFLVLSAAIDYHLDAPARRRASAREIEQLFQLLRDTRDRLDPVRAASLALQ